DGLACLWIGADRCPITLLFDVLVRYRSLDDENERCIKAILGGGKPGLHVLIAPLAVIEHAVVEVHFRQSWNRTHEKVFDARLSRRGNGDGVAVATHTVRRPEYMNVFDGWFALRFATVRRRVRFSHGVLL